MREAVGLIMILLIAAGPVLAAADDGSKIVLQINENSGTWSGNNSPKTNGSQHLVYFSIGYRGTNSGATFLGSWADTTYKYNGGRSSDFHLGTLLDSTISTFYKLVIPGGALGVRVGVDINLPTGYASLNNSELESLFLDNAAQELNIVTSFGRGLDIAPNFVISLPVGPLVVGAALRYEWVGKYDPTSEVQGDEYDPGDVLTFITSLQYKPSDVMLMFVDLTAMMTSRDRQAGEYVFKQANLHSLDLRVVRQHNLFRATYSLSYSIQQKNQDYQNGGSDITTELRNANSNYYDFFVNIGYPFAHLIQINGIAGYKRVLENAYSRGEQLYDGGYTKLYLGGGASFIINKGFFWTVDLRMFQLSNNADALETTNTTYQGINFDIGIVYTFGG